MASAIRGLTGLTCERSGAAGAQRSQMNESRQVFGVKAKSFPPRGSALCSGSSPLLPERQVIAPRRRLQKGAGLGNSIYGAATLVHSLVHPADAVIMRVDNTELGPGPLTFTVGGEVSASEVAPRGV